MNGGTTRLLASAATPLERREALIDPVQRWDRMLEIRRFEDRIKELFAEGLIHGTTHTCQGQEAVSIGIAVAARPTDSVCCTYRGHGTALALGMTLDTILGEITGRTVGAIGGVGGSMHLSERSVGLLPTSAIVGAGIPIAAGAALSAQVLGRDDCAIGVFGDGATNIGAFHEGLNLASIWKLPVVFVCENNTYGEYSRIDLTTPVADLAVRAGSYGMPSEIVDGQEVDAVVAALSSALARARAGEGPTLVECKTYRYSGHSRADAGAYRPAGELDEWLARDPIVLYRRQLVDSGALAETDADALERSVGERVEACVERVMAAEPATVASMFRNVCAPAASA
jgi:pyruvate dehydrogenase E1 component alpha subunit